MREEDVLWRLVYISSCVVADISAIAPALLAAARRNNARNDITGVLIFSAGSFLQVLEGARSDVEATFTRIRRDRRHRGLIPLLEEPIDDRMFGAWSMSWLDMPKDHPLASSVAKTLDDVRMSQTPGPAADKVRILIASFTDTAS